MKSDAPKVPKQATAIRDGVLKPHNYNHHDIPSSGHLRDEKTLKRLKLNFYWLSMKETVEDYCKSCHLCIARKTNAKVKAPLGSYVVGEPFRHFWASSQDSIRQQ